MYLSEKRPGPKGVVRYREVSAIWDVRYKEVLLQSLPVMQITILNQAIDINTAFFTSTVKPPYSGHPI